ncbi:MAG: hypothetical protein CL946_01430 [Ectothiorhodospiraceae bacterium]|nr:hypothetical protein [Ectothiorhodospiraceae bacterium]
MKNTSMLLAAVLVLCATVPANGQWEQTNGPWTGLSIYDFEIDNDRVYVATITGVYASDDRAESWYSLDLDGLPYNAKDLEVTENYLFVAGDSKKFYRYSFARQVWDTLGVLLLPQPLGTSISFECTNQTLYMLVHGNHVYATNDEGSSWDTIKVPNPDVAHNILAEFEGEIYIANNDNQILRLNTIDNTWDVLATAPSKIKSLSFNNPTPGVTQLYVGCWSGLFRMEHYDSEWHELHQVSPLHSVFSMAFNPRDSVIYALLDQGIYHSFDGGNQWHDTDEFFVRHLSTTLCYLDETLLAGTSNHGIYKSTDHGVTWQPSVTGITNAWIDDLINVDHKLIAGVGVRGTRVTGVYSSTDNGNSWYNKTAEGYFGSITSLAHVEGVIVGSAWNSRLIRSFDLGDTWEPIWGTSLFSTVRSNATHFFCSGPDRVFVSSNRGSEWRHLDHSNPLSNIGTISVLGQSIFMNIWHNTRQYVYRSDDNGITWDSTTYGLYGHVPTVIGNTGNLIFLLSNEKLHITSDEGTTWLEYPEIYDYTPRRIKCLFYKDGNIIAGTEVGIYRATLDNKQWVDISDGIGHTYTTCFVSNEDSLFVGTLYKGVWSRSFNEFIVVDTEEPTPPPTFHLAQNYPNPICAGAGATIDFSLPKPEHVTLKVYSILGREIATVFQGEKHAGTHSASLPTSSLSSGMYIYRLAAGDKTAERIMLVQ